MVSTYSCAKSSFPSASQRQWSSVRRFSVELTTFQASLSFSVAADGGTAPYAYQWEYLKPGASAWTNVTKNGTSATYTLTALDRHNGYRYRCDVTDAAGTVVQSVVALLTVNAEDAPVILEHPKNVMVCVGDRAVFSVKAGGTGLTYQWQYLKPGAAAWVNVTVRGTSASYKLTTQERHNGYRYRCAVTASNGKTAISNVAYLAVYSNIYSIPDLEIEWDPHFGSEFPTLDLPTELEALWEKGLLSLEDAMTAAGDSCAAGSVTDAKSGFDPDSLSD